MFSKRTLILPVFLLLIIVLARSQFDSDRTIKVAGAKGRVIMAQMLSLSPRDQFLRDVVLSDPQVGTNGELILLAVDTLGVARSAEISACTANCVELTFYDDANEGTVHVIYDWEAEKVVRVSAETTARPNPTPYILNRIVDIAATDERVSAILGDLRKAEVAMVPISTWLADDACNDDWCVDLTFHDPAGTGKIFHVVVNLTQDKVARTFYSRARANRAKLQADELDDDAPLFTDGCHEQHGWDVCWEMTPHDGLNFYNARFNDTLIFSSAKISQVEAFYPSWPGGYRDEIGHRASVPPKFDTRITDFGNSFEIRQLFTEPFDWPNCICCYRYEQIIQFNDDGSFEPRFVSQGPGCEDLSEYRPFWRINVDLDGSENDEAWLWDLTQWTEATIELEHDLYEPTSLEGQRLATFDGDLHYKWEPVPTDPLNLDEGRLFLIDNEGEDGIEAGPPDTYEPPRRYANGDAINAADSDLVVWFTPVLKTKWGGPWWCAPDPEPEFSPCEAIMRVVPDTALRQPTAEEVAQITAQLQATPEPTATNAPSVEPSPDLLPTAQPTARPIAGDSAETIILNAGCGACHLIGELGEAGKVGPDLSNMGSVAGKRVPGQSAETYLYNAIIYPDIFIASECPNGACLAGVMPSTYHQSLNEQQVATVVDYLTTLTDETVIVGDGIVSLATTPNATAAQPAPNNNGSPLGLIVSGSIALFLLIVMVIVLLRRRPTV